MNTYKTIKNSFMSLLVALMMVGTALGTTGGDDTAKRTIEITGNDQMKFDVTSIEAAPGEEITIVLTTKSRIPKQAMAHNVVVLDKDADVQAFVNASAKARDNEYIATGEFENQVIAATALAGGGETVEVTFTAPEEAGDYEYVCSFPGHFSGGMKGVLTVKN